MGDFSDPELVAVHPITRTPSGTSASRWRSGAAPCSLPSGAWIPYVAAKIGHDVVRREAAERAGCGYVEALDPASPGPGADSPRP
jgi:hypothetical protein